MIDEFPLRLAFARCDPIGGECAPSLLVCNLGVERVAAVNGLAAFIAAVEVVSAMYGGIESEPNVLVARNATVRRLGATSGVCQISLPMFQLSAPN